jgi:hypothetical protein
MFKPPAALHGGTFFSTTLDLDFEISIRVTRLGSLLFARLGNPIFFGADHFEPCPNGSHLEPFPNSISSDLNDFSKLYPLVNIQKAIEHGDL